MGFSKLKGDLNTALKGFGFLATGRLSSLTPVVPPVVPLRLHGIVLRPEPGIFLLGVIDLRSSRALAIHDAHRSEPS